MIHDKIGGIFYGSINFDPDQVKIANHAVNIDKENSKFCLNFRSTNRRSSCPGVSEKALQNVWKTSEKMSLTGYSFIEVTDRQSAALKFY